MPITVFCNLFSTTACEKHQLMFCWCIMEVSMFGSEVRNEQCSLYAVYRNMYVVLSSVVRLVVFKV